MFSPLTKLDKLAYTFLAIIFSIGLYYGFTDPEYFDKSFTKEDGLVEWVTTIALLLLSLLSLYRLITLGKHKKTLWVIGTIGFVLVFFFGAGEEISWGQRIFDIESSEFFKQNNAQQETNLHNMVVEGKKINKIIFSNLLMIVMVLYLIVFPLLYSKKEKVRWLFDSFGVPLVKWHHTIAFIICTLLVIVIGESRQWELYELAFGIIFLLIFINPVNKYIFKK